MLVLPQDSVLYSVRRTRMPYSLARAMPSEFQSRYGPSEVLGEEEESIPCVRDSM